jgi:hypothetical protein
MRGSGKSDHDDIDETAALEEALEATSYIMDDDLELAEEMLLKGNSAFHKVFNLDFGFDEVIADYQTGWTQPCQLHACSFGYGEGSHGRSTTTAHRSGECSL